MQWPRDVELAACINWMRDYRGCSGCGQKAWFIGVCVRAGLENTTRQAWSRRRLIRLYFSKGTPLRPPMSSSSWSSRMVAASFSKVEAARDSRVSIRNVRNVCETNGWFWICVGMVIAILTVLSGVPPGISISDDCSQQKVSDKNAAWRRQMKRARTPCRISKIRTTAWNPDGTGATCRRETCRRWWNWCGLRAQELQVLLVRRQRGQSCLCENLAKCCWDNSLSLSDEIFSFVTTEQIVCK